MKLDLYKKQWNEFDLRYLFKVQRGKRLIARNRKSGNIPYYSATSTNNGLTDFIENPLFISKNKIIVTTFCDSYYIEGDFTASDEITILGNELINEYSGKFITRIILSNQNKYAFGRKAFSERLERQKIILPTDVQGNPNYAFMEAYMKQKEQEKLDKYKQFISKRLVELQNFKEVENIEDKEWKEFEIEDIFKIKSGIRLTKVDMAKGNKPFIGATDSNNGITEFTANSNSSEDSNVLGVNYNGSVVENFYHPYSAIFSDDVKRLSFTNIAGNKYLYLFAKTQILKQRAKYKYGYKFNAKRMSRQKIMLPVNQSGQPDYDFMENYMKRLEYQKLKKYLEIKNNK